MFSIVIKHNIKEAVKWKDLCMFDVFNSDRTSDVYESLKWKDLHMFNVSNSDRTLYEALRWRDLCMFSVFNRKIYACSIFLMYTKLLNGKIYTCSLFLIVTEYLYEYLKWKDLCMFNVFNIDRTSTRSRQIERFTRVQLLRANLMGLHLASSLATQSRQLSPPRVSQCMSFQTFTMHPFRLGDLPTIWLSARLTGEDFHRLEGD